MKKALLIVNAILVAMIATSCGGNCKPREATGENVETVAVDTSNIVNLSYTDADGNNIDLIFDDNNEVVNINYMGEEAVLTSQKPASGFWYANENYELIGKGNDIRLTKDGQVVFEHKDEIAALEAKNEKGDVLNIEFNKTTGEAKICLNGGEQIDLAEKSVASGFCYTNSNYELSGKGDHYKLTKDGVVLFEN